MLIRFDYTSDRSCRGETLEAGGKLLNSYSKKVIIEIITSSVNHAWSEGHTYRSVTYNLHKLALLWV